MGRHTTRAQDIEIYQERDRRISQLRKLSSIDVSDFKDIHRTGRFILADQYWNLLTDTAKYFLLHDEHPHVRSCAEISQRDELKRQSVHLDGKESE